MDLTFLLTEGFLMLYKSIWSNAFIGKLTKVCCEQGGNLT
ncbi:hypothetical protein ADIS_0194 [Lunatimonas lonarensis]|uniref:Uncharacterized protein n=1 Tax=Lunatimonas lonarensis TaxID=1232681 RepID=R7ZZ31_9BACT|nr:hypothetical protein ADIS_0194 [Lunatimonas lonarensis]